MKGAARPRLGAGALQAEDLRGQTGRRTGATIATNAEIAHSLRRELSIGRRSSQCKTAGAAAAALAAVITIGCGGAPRVKATSDFRTGALRHGKVLFVPLAVSQELGDERTGIVLSDGTRALASETACKNVIESLSDPALVCLDQDRAGALPAFAQIQLLFARDQPIPSEVWQALRQATGAHHALLFRPEAVSSSQEVSRKETMRSPLLFLGSGSLLATTALVSGIVAAETIRTETNNETELTYVVSASLVDMESGKLLKVGVHSGSDSRTVKHNLGFAEPPPAAPILEKIMTRLGQVLLEE